MLRRFLSPRWLAFHLLVLVLVAVFCALGWWQLRRAAEGNALSFGYALEWPAFAAFTVFVWYRTVRDTVRPPLAKPHAEQHADPHAGPHAGPPTEPPAGRSQEAAFTVPVLPARPAPAAVPEDEDPELAAYNRYLASLAETDRRS